MIVFYNKKTGHIIGTIDGRVHSSLQLEASLHNDSIMKDDIDKVIIGFEDMGKTILVTDEEGSKQPRNAYREHNPHLWKHQLAFENGSRSGHILRHKVVLNKDGEVTDIVKQ